MGRFWGLFIATYLATGIGAYMLSLTPIPILFSYSSLNCNPHPDAYPLDGLTVWIPLLAFAAACLLRRLAPQSPVILSGHSAGFHFKLSSFGFLAIFVVYHAAKTSMQLCDQLVESPSPGKIEANIVVGSLFATMAAHLLFDLRRYRLAA